MKDTYKTKREQGFTIIEVLIVLAIAGLIILIVLLAVPALQRNSRNTAIRSDVQSVVGGISEYVSNNNGRMPTNVTGTGAVTISQGTSGSPADPRQVTTIQGATQVTTVATAPSAVDPGSIQVRLRSKCDGTTSARAVAIYYSLETSGSNSLQCQDS